MGALAEALPTVLTRVRPLTSVDPLVLSEVRAVAEALSAVPTCIWPLASGDLLVPEQV